MKYVLPMCQKQAPAGPDRLGLGHQCVFYSPLRGEDVVSPQKREAPRIFLCRLWPAGCEHLARLNNRSRLFKEGMYH